jgi:DNA-directed RNA polymerase subunit RPC12/RpoP/anti-anti-sigma regulatory factor
MKEQKDDLLVVRLAGSIEESVNFESMIGMPTGKVQVNTKEVPRINSVGVKGWIKYFSSLQQKGAQLNFVECSTAIVEQINLISNFTCGGTVESVYVPFSCGQCRAEFIALFKTEDLKRIAMDLPQLDCPKCGGKASFDDIPEEYFAFLSR